MLLRSIPQIEQSQMFSPTNLFPPIIKAVLSPQSLLCNKKEIPAFTYGPIILLTLNTNLN